MSKFAELFVEVFSINLEEMSIYGGEKQDLVCLSNPRQLQKIVF
jgi:hypothetical protein